MQRPLCMYCIPERSTGDRINQPARSQANRQLDFPTPTALSQLCSNGTTNGHCLPCLSSAVQGRTWFGLELGSSLRNRGTPGASEIPKELPPRKWELLSGGSTLLGVAPLGGHAACPLPKQYGTRSRQTPKQAVLHGVGHRQAEGKDPKAQRSVTQRSNGHPEKGLTNSEALSNLAGDACPSATLGGGNRGSCLTHANWGF